MPLTDVKIKNAKAAGKAYKLYDERGLLLIVTPRGNKWWRFRYRFADKEKLLSLGVYPDVGLKDARGKRDEARRLLAHFIDPGIHRQAQKAAKRAQVINSFEFVAREWYAKYAPSGPLIMVIGFSDDWSVTYSLGSASDQLPILRPPKCLPSHAG
jgi:hypothetical protein